MALLQGLVEGVTSAMSPAVAQENQQKRADRRATSQEELQATTQSILNDVKGVQQKIAALGPTPDPKQLAEYQGQLHKLRQTFTDLYHPVKNPGHLPLLGRVLNSIRGQQPGTPDPTRMAQADVWGAGAPVQPPGNPEADYIKNLEGAGFSHDDAVKAARVKAGLDARAVEPKPKVMMSIEPDPESPTGYSKVVKDQKTGEEISRERNVLPPRGFIASESTTTDPFGVTSTTKRTPVLPGSKPSTTAPPPKKAGEMKKELEGKAAGGAKQLDAEGHIPASAKVNPQLREAANNLIDGMDVSKLPIPQRDRAAAEELAKKYGWTGQGLFGPKDKLLIRESTGILNQLAKSDSLSVLDDTTSRLKLQQVLQSPDKRTVFGQTIQAVTAQNLNTKEQEFVTLYNQAVGRISGLAQLVRSGRPTEATIERLKQELPNPATTSSSDHARQKLAQIQNEIDIALEKGQFVEGGTSGEGISDDEFLKKF